MSFNAVVLASSLIMVAILTGCAVVQPSEPPVSDNRAVTALVDDANLKMENGQFPAAIAPIERALRLEPKNPRLWSKLAQANLGAGNAQAAEGFAARSNSWAGTNRSLLAQNWRLISEARAHRGDEAGAQSALDRARSFE